jgi:Rrf2 family protein
MPEALDISQDESLAVHAMALLAQEPAASCPAKGIASRLGVSTGQLSRVMQRLASAGFVKSAGNPGDGFSLTESGESASVLEVLESIGGPLAPKECVYHPASGPGAQDCPFEEVLRAAHNAAVEGLSQAKVADLKISPPVAPDSETS